MDSQEEVRSCVSDWRAAGSLTGWAFPRVRGTEASCRAEPQDAVFIGDQNVGGVCARSVPGEPGRMVEQLLVTKTRQVRVASGRRSSGGSE
jgi:hypothetical protein